jgi:hypothetical protein
VSAEIVEFPTQSVADIPGLLRNIADQVEAGQFGNPACAVLVIEGTAGDWPAVFGLGGEAIPPRALWLLELAKGFLVANHVERA